MSDSTDNTTELDSYGVWVKRPSSTEDTSSENLDIDAAFDIPDFPEEEIIVEDTPAEEIEIPEVASDEIDLSDFDIPVEEDIPADEILPEDIQEETIPEIEETSLEDFTEIGEEEIPEISDETADISIEDFDIQNEDGEISLDEFMDGGFSDESVASGNNGFAPGEEPAAATEDVSADFMEDGEISLDDFLDGGDFSSPVAESKPQTEDIVDEKPLEMDISFDSDVESIETEDNIQTEEPIEEETEFASYETDTFSDGASHSTEAFGDTEEIDLSDFGIDADAEETPITQNVEESKMKDEVVDFDLSVSDEKLTSAPVVTEVKEEEPVEETPVVEEAAAPAPQVTEAASNTNNELLQQIIDELSGMKAEINALKSNLEQIQSAKPEASVCEEPVIEESTEDFEDQAIIPEVSEEDSTGFFDDTDGDDTIALSGDELDNMLSNVEISESEEPVIEETAVIEEEEPVIEETAVEEPVIEEEIVEEPVTEEIEIPETNDDDSAGFFDDIDGDDTIALSGDELDNMLNNVEISEAEEPVIEETISEEPVIEEVSEEPVIEETIETEEIEDIPEEIDIEPVSTETVDDDIFGSVEDSFGSDETETIEINEEEALPEDDIVMEEPDLDDIVIEEESSQEDELPEEISIPKVDDILVESANNDFMDSIKDTTEEENEKVEDFDDFMNADLSPEESLTESNLDYLSEEELPEDTAEETEVVEEAETEEFSSVDDIFGETAEEPAIEEEPVLDEPVIEEEPVDTIEETAVDESEVVIPETPAPAPAAAGMENDALKNDIKSVLLYMDQLLENLPEDKIVEFAKSDEFATYKKLFSELGLA